MKYRCIIAARFFPGLSESYADHDQMLHSMSIQLMPFTRKQSAKGPQLLHLRTLPPTTVAKFDWQPFGRMVTPYIRWSSVVATLASSCLVIAPLLRQKIHYLRRCHRSTWKLQITAWEIKIGMKWTMFVNSKCPVLCERDIWFSLDFPSTFLCQNAYIPAHFWSS